MPNRLPSDAALDRRLVRLASQGDGGAWGRLVERHSPLVMAITRSYRISEEDRADAYQHLFVELHRSLASLQDVESLPAWIRTVCSRHCLKIRQKQDRLSPEDPMSVLEARSSGDSTDDGLLELERSHLIRLSLEKLSEKCQKLIHLLFYEDPPLSYHEASQQLGLAIGSLGVTRQRCLDSLEKLLRAREVL